MTVFFQNIHLLTIALNSSMLIRPVPDYKGNIWKNLISSQMKYFNLCKNISDSSVSLEIAEHNSFKTQRSFFQIIRFCILNSRADRLSILTLKATCNLYSSIEETFSSLFLLNVKLLFSAAFSVTLWHKTLELVSRWHYPDQHTSSDASNMRMNGQLRDKR